MHRHLINKRASLQEAQLLYHVCFTSGKLLSHSTPIYTGFNISLTAVLFPFQSLSVCGQSHKSFDISTPYETFLFSRSRKMEMDLFVIISVKQHIYGLCCWLNYFPFPVFSACTGNWIIAFETWFTAATFPPTPHSISRTSQPCPIQMCALLACIVVHKWMVRLSTLEASVTH